MRIYAYNITSKVGKSLRKPDFEVSENTIKIVLPVFETNVDLTEDEKVIYKFLSKTMLKPISEIAPYVPFGKSKTTQLLKAMGEKGVVAVEGKGRGTKYIIKWVGVYESILLNRSDWETVVISAEKVRCGKMNGVFADGVIYESVD